jgi:hypothetical protein
MVHINTYNKFFQQMAEAKESDGQMREKPSEGLTYETLPS